MSRAVILGFPQVVGAAFAVVTGSSLTSIERYYTLFMLLLSILALKTTGILITLAVGASVFCLLDYLALYGLAFGIMFQAPRSAAQTVLSPKEALMGVAVVT